MPRLAEEGQRGARTPEPKEEPKDKPEAPVPIPRTSSRVPTAVNKEEQPSFGRAQRYQEIAQAKGKPFWETDGFKKFVQSIKDAPAPAVMGQATPIASLIPPAPVETPVKNYRLGKSTLKIVETEVKRDVVRNLPTPPPGASKQDITNYVNREVKARMDVYKKPKTFFMPDGTPFFMGGLDDEKQEFLSNLELSNTLSDSEKRWMKIKYEIPFRLKKLGQGLGNIGLATKEYLTERDTDNPLGVIAQLGYNTTLLGIEHLRHAASSLTTEEALQDIERRMVTTQDPDILQRLTVQRDKMQKDLAFQKVADQRIEEAKATIDRSWAELNDVRQKAKEGKLPPAGIGTTMQERMEFYAKQKEEEEQAKLEAENLRGLAANAYASGDYETAMSYIYAAQDQDKKAQVGDPYGAYTWIREPEKEKEFRDAMALLEIQKGEPLTKEEIRRTKEYYANSWTELGGELIFDFLNLVPVSMLDDVFKLTKIGVKAPFKAIGKGFDVVAEDLPALKKVSNALGTPVRWFRRQTVASGGNQIMRETHSTLTRIAQASASPEDFVKTMDKVSSAVLEARRSIGQDAALDVFQRYKNEVRGMKNIVFDDFKKLMDAGEHVNPAEWGIRMEKSLARQKGKMIYGIEDFAGEFHKAYVDPHRIFPGSQFTDDTIFGQISKTVRNLTGDEVNQALKVTGFDEAVKAWGETLGTGTRTFLRNTNRTLEYALMSAGSIRDWWITAVLSTPRWPVLNMVDTGGRGMIAGSNILGDLKTLFTNSQGHFAGELAKHGTDIPLDISQSMARMDIDLAENVTTALVTGDFKPTAGLFSYWKRSYKNFLADDPSVAKVNIIDGLLSSLPDGKLKGALGWLSDGFGVKTPALLKSYPGAIQDFNTAIEFTFRLKMFHNNYFKAFEELSPVFLSKSVEGLSPATREVAEYIWKASDGSPARMQAMADEILGKVDKGTPSQWSNLVPPNLDELAKGMDETQKHLLVGHFKSSVNDYIQQAKKVGKTVTAEDMTRFVDDYVSEMQYEIQAVMEQTWEVRGMDGTINKDLKPNPVPKGEDIRGAAPRNYSESPRMQEIQEATSRIKRPGTPFRARKASDIADDFETAASGVVPVERITGNDVRFAIKDGKPLIQIGDEALKSRPAKLFDQLHEALISTIKYTDEDNILRGGFATVNEYDQVLRGFMNDLEGPTRLLGTNERQFITIVDQFTNNPQMMELLKRTGKKQFSFDAAVDIYRHLGSYDDVYGFNKPFKQIIEEFGSGKGKPAPGYYSAAGQDEAYATSKLFKTITPDTPTELRSKIHSFMDQWSAMRSEMKDFKWRTEIDMRSGKSRQQAWDDIWYAEGADAFLKEAKIKNDLAELMLTDAKAAEKYMDEALDDFAGYFLRENGYDVVWDAGRQKILEVTLTKNGVKKPLLSSLYRKAIDETFYSKAAQKRMAATPTLKINVNGELDIHSQLSMNLRDTFNMNSQAASSWANIIENHAKRWAKETGQDVTAYYERLGFQRLEKGYGLGTVDDLRLVKNGAVKKSGDGYVFYGLESSNFETMVRETGGMFFDDLMDMAKYSDTIADDLKAIRAFIEETSGQKIRLDRLNQKQTDVFTEMFTRYVAEGVGPDIKLKPAMERFKSYLADTFKAVHTTPLGQDLSDDVYRRLNSLFIEGKMKVTPKVNKRVVKVMAEEANLVSQSDDELLKIINNSLDTSKSTYSNLADVPKEVAARAFGTADKPFESVISKEMQEAWETWKTQRALRGFPDEALATPDTFKAYLNDRIAGEWGETSWQYNRMMADVENWEDAMVTHFHGTKHAESLSPRVSESMLGDDMKTWIRNNESIISNYEGARRVLDGWKPHLENLANGVNPLYDLPKANKAELGQWIGKATEDKAEMVSTIIKGGNVDGAVREGVIDKVNRFMIDYQHRNIFDQTLRNFFPFWMFPSRSIPFWIETMATHPQIIAGYEKIQRMSRSQRYQAGAVTSKGKPLPSFDGYIQIPGTDTWFNPLAPFSFRYILDVHKTMDDVAWRVQGGEDVDPKAFVAKELLENSQIYGFGMSPWAAFLIKSQWGISDEIIPRSPLTPHISLIPRWFVKDTIHKLNRINFGKLSGFGDAIYPEAHWHDYLVENRIYENALMQLQSGNLSPEQKERLQDEMTEAVKNKDNELWNNTYKELTNDESLRNLGSFFTGIYAKPFSDGQAELLKLRNDRNLLISSLNNEFQRYVFDLPMDSEAAYENYISQLNTDEGWIYRLRSDSGWVTDEAGHAITNPAERAKQLALDIQQSENQALYYQKSAETYNEYNARLRALPIGATFERRQEIYDWLQTEMDTIDYLNPPRASSYTNKPSDLIAKDLKKDWYSSLQRFAPRYEPQNGQTYDEYLERMEEWKENLPELARRLMPAFTRQRDVVTLLGALREDQQLPDSFFASLAAETSRESVDQWKVETDDILDAMNNGWEELYWKEYWNTVMVPKKNEMDSVRYSTEKAEQDFYRRHPTPPSAEDLFTWIQGKYGDRFTFEEVQKYAGESAGALSVEERLVEGQEDPETYKKQQDVWQMMSNLGPGSRNDQAFKDVFVKNGGDLHDLDEWYKQAETGNIFSTQPERLAAFHETMKKTMQQLDVKPPSSTDLVKMATAEQQNNKFKQLVTQELGEDFYTLLDFYYSMDTFQRKDWRKEQKEMYTVIRDYYSFKTQYGDENPVWKDYYGFDLTPTVGLEEGQEKPASFTGGTFTPASISDRKNKQPPEGSMIPSQGGYRYDPAPYFGIQSRLASTLPPEFTRAVGSQMMWEIQAVYSGRRLSSAAVSFLQGLASRHPEWSSNINDILNRNAK